jgi:hypothetical protein
MGAMEKANFSNYGGPDEEGCVIEDIMLEIATERNQAINELVENINELSMIFK